MNNSYDYHFYFDDTKFQFNFPSGLEIKKTGKGLILTNGSIFVTADFRNELRRLKPNNLERELIIHATKIKNGRENHIVVDATAGLGEDSLLLAAAGFQVRMYEKDPVIAALLSDALERARKDPDLMEIASRMELFPEDSIPAMRNLPFRPDVILLDPMFPERTKSAQVKKKFQLLHLLARPCEDEKELLAAAKAARPKKIVIKRPVKGPWLDDEKPDAVYKGKAIRYDVLIFPD